MLNSLQLANFKAFGGRTLIPLAPITLIFGQNSAGKSSILQSLNLLKQTRESRDGEALLLPRAENGLVDLGSFQELVFDHNLNNVLSIRLDFGADRASVKSPAYPKFLRDKRSIGLELSFSRKSAKEEIRLEGFKLCGEDPSSFIAEFEAADLTDGMSFQVPLSLRSERGLSVDRLRTSRCGRIGDETDQWRSTFENTRNSRTQLLKHLEIAKTKLSNLTNTMLGNFFDDDLTRSSRADSHERRQALQATIRNHISFLSRDFDYSEFAGWMTKQQLGTLVLLDGFVPVHSRSGDGERSIDDILYRFQNRTLIRREWTADIGYASVYAGRILEKTLASLFPLGPFRKPPSRWYIFTGTTPKDVGYQGNLLPDLLFREPGLLKETNSWLNRLDFGYELKVHQLGVHPSDLFELRLLDKRRGRPIEVGLSDVGFGISQILPLVVQSLVASDQIITIEQPEVHIHPRLQADLGDLLIESIQEPRRNQFIIETHSEHLALRLQRRVRERSSLLKPEDVSFIYVNRGPSGATVSPLRLDEEGDFIDDFPGGFFPERLRELH